MAGYVVDQDSEFLLLLDDVRAEQGRRGWFMLEASVVWIRGKREISRIKYTKQPKTRTKKFGTPYNGQHFTNLVSDPSMLPTLSDLRIDLTSSLSENGSLKSIRIRP